ncbi:CHAT domain-containing protein [Streptomyces goshikiensis]|uniref:CHAT domain-containing protein n=1 Tax=Streptomyces goshikiensis TaxID=1942 RepID=UPI0033B03D3C
MRTLNREVWRGSITDAFERINMDVIMTSEVSGSKQWLWIKDAVAALSLWGGWIVGRHLALNLIRTVQARATVRSLGYEEKTHLPLMAPSTSASRLNNVSLWLTDTYRSTGRRELLNEALAVQQLALKLTPKKSHNRPAGLNTLASIHGALYNATSDQPWLDEAVTIQRSAVTHARGQNGELRASLSMNLAIWLGQLYDATGNRGFLDEAVDAARESVAALRSPVGSSLDVLSCRLDDLHIATGNPIFLLEAVELQRQAVDITPPESDRWPGIVGNLANRLKSLFRIAPDLRILREAIDFERQALQATSETHAEIGEYKGGLANSLSLLYEHTKDRTILSEAVELSREALQATPVGRSDRAIRVHNYAMDLALLFELDGDAVLLHEARQLTAESRGRGPIDYFRQARTRAHLARLDGDVDSALHELQVANEAFIEERERLAGDLTRLRDLAGQVERVVGDLVGCHVVKGDCAAAVEVIESNRLWLNAPPPSPRGSGLPAMAVAWVSASRWETVVISTLDHRTTSYDATIIPLDRQALGRKTLIAFNAARTSDPGPEFEDIVTIVSRIVDAMPRVSRLLIVPVGPLALLPYGAARRETGEYVIDQTAITIAPSLAWAIESHRDRPHGNCIGAFHPGEPPLNLDSDRDVFASHFPNAAKLDSPTPGQVLDQISNTTEVLHFSCHGNYNIHAPAHSSLELNGSLVLQEFIDIASAPWLVNLSSCDTAIPDITRSEQVISFPTCFLIGGAAHVIGCQWNVANECASLVNQVFYDGLTAGIHPAVALQLAVSAIRSSGKRADYTPRAVSPDPDQRLTPTLDLAHPFWWAAFSHYGSPW